MPLGYSYIIMGAGQQGLAAAYDMILFGQAGRVTLADGAPAQARRAVERLKRLLGPARLKNLRLSAAGVDARRPASLKKVLRGHQAALSALPYYLNPGAAQAAIAAGVHYNDLGGHFDTTRKIMRLDAKARRAGVTLIPDCGVSPGLCNSLAACAIDQLSNAREVHMYCGGLPQSPRPPLNYKIVFNLEGVLGNYFGKAYVLKKGRVAVAAPLSGREELDFGPLGKLEAAVTGGATSTCPWTYRGRLRAYDYKTLRYPGHWDKIQLLKDLGLVETEPLALNGISVVPRDLFVAAAEPRLRFPDDRDFLVMRVLAQGRREGKRAEIVYDLMDRFDPKTGFTAMQRTTGFSAAVITEMLAQGSIPHKGVAPVEKAVPGRLFLDEIRRRGIAVRETVKVLGG